MAEKEKNVNAMPQLVVVNGRYAVEVYEWQAYKLREAEFRLGGFFRGRDNNIRSIVTEPIKGIDAPVRLVETVDGNWYHLNDVATPARKMDLMYEVTRWATNNVRRAPENATEMILEHLKVDKEPVVEYVDVKKLPKEKSDVKVEQMEETPVDETIHVKIEQVPVVKKRKGRSDKGKARPHTRKDVKKEETNDS